MALKIRGVTVVDFGGSSDSSNIALGSRALDSNATGICNVAIGKDALGCVLTSSKNVVIGADAVTSLAGGDNNVVIGYNAQLDSQTQSNQIILGNDSSTSFRIPGLGLNTNDASAGTVLCWTGSQLQFATVTTGGLDSALATQLIDSAYVQARQSSVVAASGADSSFVTSSIDSAIQAITNGAVPGLDTLGEISTALNDDPDAYNTLLGFIQEKIDSAQTRAIVDSDYVQARQSSVGTGGLDSALVTQLVDSAYVQLRQSSVGTGGLDSALAIQLIDSAYVQLRQSSGLDSALAIQLIDSAYVQARQSSVGTGGLDSALATQLIDSSYVQARQDFAYSSLTGAPNVLDSSDITNLVDSNYVALRVPTTLDSASIITLVDSAYVQARQDFAYSSLTGTPDLIDSALVTQLIDSAYVQLRQSSANQSLNTTDSVEFAGLTISGDLTVSGTTTTVNSITYKVVDPLLHLADSNEVSDVVDIGFIGHYSPDGGSTREHTGFFRDASNSQYYIFNGLVDSAFDSSLPTNIVNRSGTGFELATLNVSSIVGNYAGFDSDVTAAGLATQSYVTTTIDSAYVQLRQSPGLDSAAVAEIAGGLSGLDSTNTINLIDSAYIELRRPAEAIFGPITGDGSNYAFVGDGFPTSANDPTLYLQRGLTYIFRMNASGHPFYIRQSAGGSDYNTGVTNNGAATGDIIFNVPMDAPNTLVYQCSVHGGMLGTIYIFDQNSFAASGSIDSALVTQLIDSAYVQARQDFAYSSLTGAPNVLDSAAVAEIAGGLSGLDSTNVIQLIDSAYVQARQTAGGGGGLDSALAIQLIDSAYIQARIADASFTDVDFIYDSFAADGTTTVFNIGESAELADMLITINGIIQRPGIDYTFVDSTLTFLTAPDSDATVGVRKLFAEVRAQTNIDSALFVSLIDSAYVQLRQSSVGSGGVDADADGNIQLGDSGDAYTTDTVATTLYEKNTVLGAGAMPSAGVSVKDNVVIGYNAFCSAGATGDKWYNTIIGSCAGENLVGYCQSTIIGYQAGRAGTARFATVVGSCAGRGNTPDCATFVGHRAGENGTGQGKIAIGMFAGYNTGSSSEQVFIGCRAGFSGCGAGLIAIGACAAYGNGLKNYTIAIGNSVFRCNGAGQYNIGIGYNAGYVNTTGSRNVFIGVYSGSTNSTGCNNTLIGYFSGCGLTTGCNNTLIGCCALPSAATVSNEITLGDANITRFRVPGVNIDTAVTALSGTTVNVDTSAGNYTHTLTGATTYTFTNDPPSGTYASFTMIITGASTYTITWDAAVDWAGGTAPDAPGAGEVDVYTFTTVDGGTTWYGFQAGDAMA